MKRINTFILSLCFCLNTFLLVGQYNTLADITLKWDTLHYPNTQKVSFKKYQQFGNKLLAESDLSFKFYPYNNYSIINDIKEVTESLKFQSTDFGLTWQLVADSNEIKAKYLSVMAKDSSLYKFSIDAPVTISSQSSLNCQRHNYNQRLLRSISSRNIYTKVDSFNSTYFSCWNSGAYELSTHSITVIDSTLFRFQRYKSGSNSGIQNNSILPVSYSTDGSLQWFSTQFTNYNSFDNVTIDYAANGFYAFGLRDTTQIYKYPNFNQPIMSIRTSDLSNNYSIIEKGGVKYVYVSEGKIIRLRTSTNWQGSILPFNISQKQFGESSVFIDKENKYIYLICTDGIYRSEDPFFKTYKKIYPSIYSTNPIAFSILPSGIYMNDNNGDLVRSVDNGDSWQKISTSNKYDKALYINNYVFKDSTVIFDIDDKYPAQTVDFKNITPRNDNINTNKIDFKVLYSPLPLYPAYTLGKNIFISAYQSSDSGISWRSFVNPSNYANSGIIEGNEIYFNQKPRTGSNEWNFYITSDTAKTWTFLFQGHEGIPMSPAFKNDYLYIGSYRNIAKMQKSINFGNLQFINAPLNFNFIRIIHFDSTNMVVANQEGQFFLSKDDGGSWIQMTDKAFENNDFIDVKCYKNNTIFVTKQGAYLSGDFGVSWVKLTNFPLSPFLIHNKYIYTMSSTRLIRIHIDSIFKNALTDKDYGIIKGIAQIDKNTNCQKDSSDNIIAEKIIKIEPGGFSTITDKSGRFSVALLPNTYTLSTQSMRYHNACIDTFINNIKIDLRQTIDANFLFKPIPNVNDLALSLTAETPARPGFEIGFNLKVDNIGTTKADSAVLAFRFPTAFGSFISADQNGVYQNGQIIWNLKNLAVDENRQFKLRLRINPTTPLSTNLSFIGKVTLLGKTDTVLQNNEAITNLTVTGSFDPNDKTVLPEGKIPFFTNELDYLIRFQNTGTDTAFKVVVVDTLPSQLDVFTMKIVSSSHPYTVSLNKNIVTFTFDNIFLPDSNVNERASHGFIRFKIGTKAGLKVGDNINNKAAIYFDYNKPIITNIAKSELIKPSVTISKSASICQGETFNGKPYLFNTTVYDTLKATLYDTIVATNLTIKPTYNIAKDTLLKTTEAFEGVHYGNGALVVKKLKTVLGCDSTITYKIVKLNTDTKELPSEFSSFKLFPNPTNTNISINYELKKATWVEIELYNAIGQKVKILQQKTRNTEGAYQYNYDLRDIESGIYQVQIRTENGIFYRQFVKI